MHIRTKEIDLRAVAVRVFVYLLLLYSNLESICSRLVERKASDNFISSHTTSIQSTCQLLFFIERRGEYQSSSWTEFSPSKGIAFESFHVLCLKVLKSVEKS